MKGDLGLYTRSAEYSDVYLTKAKHLVKLNSENANNAVKLLFLADPIDSLDMYSVKKEDSHDPIGEHTRYVDGQEVKMEPGEELYLRCQARASNPPADIRVYHAKRDITAQVWEIKYSLDHILVIKFFAQLLTFLSFEWNSIRLGGPAQGIVTKLSQNSARGCLGSRGKGWGSRNCWGLRVVGIKGAGWVKGWWGSKGGGGQKGVGDQGGGGGQGGEWGQ